MTLFEIDARIRNILDSLYSQADEDGVVPDSEFEELEALNEERKTKLENTALYYKELRAEADAIALEAKKLTARAKAADTKAESLKKYLAMSMLKNGDADVVTSKVKVTFRASERVIIDDEGILPKECLTEKITYTPDRAKIKEAIKSGSVITGAHIESVQNIQIN